MTPINKWLPVLLLALLFQATSCKKFITANIPDDQQPAEYVYSSDQTAASVLAGMYTTLAEQALPYLNCLFLGLSADELALFNGAEVQMNLAYVNNVNPGDVPLWKVYYDDIFYANAAIEGLTASNTLSEGVKRQLMGESKFLRAFYYFNLVNIFGDVPLLTSTDYKVNSAALRTGTALVYQQIIEDLKEAQNLLREDYLNADVKTVSADRVRPNKLAATALLARVYLYTGDWANAEAAATTVINNDKYSLAASLKEVFLKNSTEAIFQLMPVEQGYNTYEGRKFILPSTGPDDYERPVYLSSISANAFEAGDARRDEWIDSVIVSGNTYHYPYKYKVYQGSELTEYSMVLRLAEQYLIRAEARAYLGNITGGNSAVSDINMIRARAGVDPVTATTSADALDAVLHERQVELFTECGHRWMDLKRLKKIDEVMPGVSAAKGGSWEKTDKLYPIPIRDITINTSLKQNPGYE